MVIISYTGMDLFLVGELNAKIHSKVAKVLNVDEDEVVFTGYDSFAYYKGHEQTSINLIIKVEMDEQLSKYQEELKDLLLEASKEYSLHAFVYFNYFKKENSYLSVNENYPRYLTSENERSEEDYDEDNNYSEEELYTGDIFKEFGDEDNDEDGPVGFDTLLRK